MMLAKDLQITGQIRATKTGMLLFLQCILSINLVTGPFKHPGVDICQYCLWISFLYATSFSSAQSIHMQFLLKLNRVKKRKMGIKMNKWLGSRVHRASTGRRNATSTSRFYRLQRHQRPIRGLLPAFYGLFASPRWTVPNSIVVPWTSSLGTTIYAQSIAENGIALWDTTFFVSLTRNWLVSPRPKAYNFLW